MSFERCVEWCADFLDVAWEFTKTPISYGHVTFTFHGILIVFFILSVICTFFSVILKGGL